VVDQRDASVVFNAIVATFGYPATVDLLMLAYGLVVGSADLMVVMIDHPPCFTVPERDTYCSRRSDRRFCRRPVIRIVAVGMLRCHKLRFVRVLITVEVDRVLADLELYTLEAFLGKVSVG
jgi:hypothetical protein